MAGRVGFAALGFFASLALCSGQSVVEPPEASHSRAADPALAGADAHYARRDEGRSGSLASPREIAGAVAGYEAAAQSPENAEARWKLARALYFQEAYTGVDKDARRAIEEKARRAGEEALRIIKKRAKARGASLGDGAPEDLAAALRPDPDAAPAFFWTAVAWGRWALAAGRFAAARTGAPEKIRDYAATVIALDPRFDAGGGYRLLGRLHHQAPRVPLLTPWVSRQKAVAYLRLAMDVDAGNFVNRQFLAEALADGGPAERAEAIRMAEKLVADSPSPTHLVEQLVIQEQVRQDLAKWKR